MPNPKIVLLDEPTVGLDPYARRKMWQMIRNLHQQGLTFILTTHYMEEAQMLCSRVAFMKKGCVLGVETPENWILQLGRFAVDHFESETVKTLSLIHIFLSLIKDIHDKLGLTVIIITHQMSVVEQICTRVAILNHGTVVEEGAVSEVFASPKSQEAKQLVYPEGYQQAIETEREEHLIRVVFNGASATQTPLIAKMAMEENIMASILFASTRSLGDKAYGNMLLGISGGKEQMEKAVAYLRRIPDIHVEAVSYTHLDVYKRQLWM